MRLRHVILLALTQLCAPALHAQSVKRDAFPAEEYVARWRTLVALIGDGAAILEGTTERPGEQPFRQANSFAYLTVRGHRPEDADQHDRD